MSLFTTSFSWSMAVATTFVFVVGFGSGVLTSRLYTTSPKQDDKSHTD